MFSLYRQAQTWGSRPSEIVGVEDEYVAYCFNEAVYLWGAYVESELHAAGEGAKTKRQAEQKVRMRMNMILNPPERPKQKTPKYVDQKQPAPKPEAGKFRDPATLFHK